MPAPRNPIKRQIWLNKLSMAHKGKPTWNKGIKMPIDFRLKMGELSKEFWTNPENREKIILRNLKISESKIGDKNPMKRPEVAAKVSIKKMGKLMGNLNPSRRVEVRAKISEALTGHTFSPEIRQKISKTLTGKLVGKLNPFYGKKHTAENIEKSRIRAINMITSGLLSNRRTAIEVRIKEALLKTSLRFNEQTPLEGITVVDFYLPEYSVVIYCDGDYWHKGEWAKKHHVIRKDNWQTKVLESRGYKVFRFGETDINSSAEKCIDLVKYFILNNYHGKLS